MSRAPGTRVIHASLALTVLAMVLVMGVVAHVYFGSGEYASAQRRFADGLLATVHGSLSAVAVILALVGSVRARRAGAPRTARFAIVGALLAAFGFTGTATVVVFWAMAGQLPAN